LYNVDIVTDLDLTAFYQKHLASGAAATLAVRHRDTKRYLVVDRNGRLCAWRNIVTEEQILARPIDGTEDLVAFSGIHVVNPGILSEWPKKEVFSIIEWYLDLAGHHHIQTFLHDDNRWIDIGKPGHIKEAEAMFQELGEDDPMIQ
jgi:NDP-sugar pyrophosphorylase family protein